MNYDKQIKTKREEITRFTSSFVELYSTPVESSGDPVKEVLDSMLFYIELKESFVSAETLQQRLNLQKPKFLMPQVPKNRPAPKKVSLNFLISEQSRYNQSMASFNQRLLNVSKYALLHTLQAEEQEYSLIQQLSKAKVRLTTVLKAFDEYKRKTKTSSHFDQAARKIQRYWRARRQLKMEREWNRATHRYVQERLNAKEAQW